MVAPFSSLANMEMQLYGGLRNNSSAPSMYNNYCGTSAYNNYGYNYMNPYNYNQQAYGSVPAQAYYPNTNFGQTIPQSYLNAGTQTGDVNGSEQTAENTTIFQGLSKSESDALVKEYQDGLEFEQGFSDYVVAGAGSTVLMMNPRILAHPLNTAKTFLGLGTCGDTNKMFDLAKNTKLEGLWKNNSYIMEEAFAQMNRTEARSLSKLGLFRKQYTQAEYNQLKGIMEKALNSGNADEIAKATETLRHAQVNNGGFFRLFKGKNTPTVASRIADSETIVKNTDMLLKNQNMTYKQAFNTAGGKIGLLFGATELLIDFGKIQTAFEEDTTTGMKQLGQSVVKAGVSALSWQGGEALGIWGASKITPKLVGKIGGKWATIIGAVARPLCGLLCNWLGRKTAKAVVGENVVNRIEAQKAAQTNEGQMQIVESVLAKANSGEKVDPQALQAIQKLYTMYA